jgi:hypothetical protein
MNLVLALLGAVLLVITAVYFPMPAGVWMGRR